MYTQEHFHFETFSPRLENKLPVGEIISFDFPAVFRGLAQDFGDARMLMNKARLNRHPAHDRAELGRHVDMCGCLGEINSRYYLTENNIPFVTDPLILESPVAGPDLVILNSLRVDVKYFAENRKFLMVTANAHRQNPKNITHYWFMKEIAHTKIASVILRFNEISQWKCFEPNSHYAVRFESAFLKCWNIMDYK